MDVGDHLIDGGEQQRSAARRAQCGAVVPGTGRDGRGDGQSGQQLREDVAFVQHDAGEYTAPSPGLQTDSSGKAAKALRAPL